MPRINPLYFAFSTVLLLGLAGCDHHLDRRDQVKFGTGDSIAANKAAQIIDPWPAAARTIEHGISGEQAEAALARMRRATVEKNPATPSGEIRSPNPALSPITTLK
jgi:hypothetical protein